MLHPFQGNLHKGMLHCPQEIPWSLEAQLLIEEYPFKIMLYFLQGILYLFKWQFHALRFLTETSPFLKGIVDCFCNCEVFCDLQRTRIALFNKEN